MAKRDELRDASLVAYLDQVNGIGPTGRRFPDSV
jgi:hypothetical protein